MSVKVTLVQVNKAEIPGDKLEALYSQALVFDLGVESFRNLFLIKEATDRGFFVDNSLSQVSEGKNQLPLLTWSFLDFLSTRKLDDQRLVELGSGNSTLWFSKKFQAVQSYETDPKWFDEISKVLPSNATVSLVDLPRLQEAIVDLKQADWLLIDFAGRRTHFIDSMLRKGVKPTQIILDNSDWYRNGATMLINAGYTEIPFFGFKSGQTWISCTSVFVLGLSDSLREGTFSVPMNTRALKNSWDQI